MGKCGRNSGLYTRLRLNRAFLHDEIVEPALIPGFDLIKNGKRCVRFLNIRIWAFGKGRDTAVKSHEYRSMMKPNL
jgi:hypothetical protein